jgi:hypothetical protein
MLSKLIVNAYNFWVVVFVAVGTISTAYGLAVIGSTVGQPNFYTYFNLATAGTPGYAQESLLTLLILMQLGMPIPRTSSELSMESILLVLLRDAFTTVGLRISLGARELCRLEV